MSDRSHGNDSGPDFSEVDLTRHDFAALRADINDIVDLPRAIGQVLRWAVLVPLVGTWLTWVVFADRMSIWFRLPYVILVGAAFLLAAIGIGLLAVLRTRVAEVDEAADRVVLTVAALHGDYLQVRAGEAELPKRELAALLTAELVFPALTAGTDTAFSTMAVASGPWGFVLRPLLKYPMAMVERRVLEVIDDDDETGPFIAPPTTDSTAEPTVEGSDLVAAAVLADLPPSLGDWYGAIHRRLSQVVDGAGTVAVGSMWTVVALSSAPVVGLLVLGWVST